MLPNAELSIAAPPAIHIDPYADDFLADPDPGRCIIRDSAPITYLPKYGVYATGRMTVVREIFKDYERFSSSAGIGLADRRDPSSHAHRRPSPINEVDPPVHTKIRAGVQKLLSPMMIRSWRGRYDAFAEKLVDQLIIRGGVIDAVPEIAEEMTYTLMPETLGLDIPRAFLPGLGEMNSFSLGPATPRQQANYEQVKDAIKFYNEAAERENVRPGTLADKIYQEEDAGTFEPGVGAGLIRVFLRASSENQYSMISALIRRLAENPDQWDKVKADPGKLKNAIEEVIRLDTPLEVDFRLVVSDTEFNGQALQGNRKIGLFIAAANRDPHYWDKPNEYDVDREVLGNHVGFGGGAHVCVGQMMARLQGESLLKALVARVDRIEPAGRPERRVVSATNSLKSLPVRLIGR